jgi:hypothetical protein
VNGILLRTAANVLPRQSVSSAISRSMRSDGFIGSLGLEFRSPFMRPQWRNKVDAGRPRCDGAWL